MNSTVLDEIKTEKGSRHIVHIINPASGSGRKFRRSLRKISDLGEDVYLTKCEGDGGDFIAELLTKDPYAHIVAHGGDGTMGEAAGGIMAADAGATALFTGVPSGSGNDFLRYMYESKNVFGKVYKIDLICANGKYSTNVLNAGFDCSVVKEAERIRKFPVMSGGFSYVAGVAVTAFKKQTFKTTVTLSGIEGENDTYEEKIDDDFLLVAIANGKYYGGGFMIAPLADTGDGYFEFVAARNVSLASFASLAAKFRAGAHIDKSTGEAVERFKDILYYRRARKISFDNISDICYDGEIVETKKIDAEIVPAAIQYTPPKKVWTQ